MPIGTAAATLIGGGVSAIAGAVGNAAGTPSSASNTSTVKVGAASAQELAGQQGLMNAYNQLQGMVGAGPGESDVAAATGAGRSLADMLQSYQQGGFLPTGQDLSTSNSFASKLFNPQQVALQQSFIDQNQSAARQAAIQGRAVSDPILRAKLAQSQTMQQQQLSANQGAWAQNFAMQQPMQRLDFAQQRAGILGGLATQAMNNRQSLAAMGEGIMARERDFRLQTATRTGTQQGNYGGGLGAGISGAFGGFSAGATGVNNILKMFEQKDGGGGGGGGGSPLLNLNYNSSNGNIFGVGNGR